MVVKPVILCDAITDLWSTNFVGTTHMTFSGVAASRSYTQNIRNRPQEKDNRCLATGESVSPSMVKNTWGSSKTVLYRRMGKRSS